MIDFVDTTPFLRIALQVVMATMHFHIAQTGLFLGVLFSHIRGPREKFGANLKIVLGVQGSQIRSRGRWFGAEISLLMMFVMTFTLFIRLSLIFLNMQMKLFRIQPLN